MPAFVEGLRAEEGLSSRVNLRPMTHSWMRGLRRRNKVSFPSYLLWKALQQEYRHLPTLEDEGRERKSVLCSEGREEQQLRA